MTESQEQMLVFRWAEMYDELKLMHHIPNGGRRDPREAAWLKKCGVKAGVPDIFLPVPKGIYHGLYIEMKAGDNKPTEKQTEWLTALRRQGYAVAVCWSHFEAERVIEQYMTQGKDGGGND